MLPDSFSVTDSDNPFFAAAPPDVRKGCAFPGGRPLFFFPLCDRCAVVQRREEHNRDTIGKAQPFRTSGGRAARVADTWPHSEGQIFLILSHLRRDTLPCSYAGGLLLWARAKHTVQVDCFLADEP